MNIGDVSGTGTGGRVTKRDILQFLDKRLAAAEPRQPFAPPASRVPPYQPGEPVEIKPLSVVRRKIAEHMVLSRRTSAHVHSVFHVDFTAVEAARAARKAEFERAGVKLTPMAFIAQACAVALARHPILNAALDGDTVVYKKDINLGVAVAIEGGLIVPVVKHADRMSLLELTTAIADVAGRARLKQLKPDEVHGGTFTITNPGQLGAQFGLPIINQPQVAILGVGTIEKRAVVVDDAAGRAGDGLSDAGLRPPADRRFRGRCLHGRRQAPSGDSFVIERVWGRVCVSPSDSRTPDPNSQKGDSHEAHAGNSSARGGVVSRRARTAARARRAAARRRRSATCWCCCSTRRSSPLG